MRFSLLLLTFFLLGLEFSGGERHFAYSQGDMAEADQVSIYLTHTLKAPKRLSQRIRHDLKYIRQRFDDRIAKGKELEEVPEKLKEIRFQSPWVPGVLNLELEPTIFKKMVTQGYQEWDEINRMLQVHRVDPILAKGGAQIHLPLHFHPIILAQLYARLPGIVGAEFEPLHQDGARIYPGMNEGKLTYLFDKAWEDCENGCKQHEYYYFTSEEGKLKYQGFWNATLGTDHPNWWYEAKKNVLLFQQLSGLKGNLP